MDASFSAKSNNLLDHLLHLLEITGNKVKAARTCFLQEKNQQVCKLSFVVVVVVVLDYKSSIYDEW